MGANFVADMNVASLFAHGKRSLIRAPLTDAVRSPAGCASLGMMMTLVDVAASDPALAACRPDWTATQDLALHGAAWLTEGPIVVDCQLVRVGKKVIIVSAEAYDSHGVEDFAALQVAIDETKRAGVNHGPTLAAAGLLSFARLPGHAAGGMDDYDPVSWMGQIRDRQDDAEIVGTMYERMGITVVDGARGALELARTPYVMNSIQSINGGAVAVLVEAGAEALRPGMVAADMQIHFLAQVKAGPARTRGVVLRDAADHSVVNLEVVDIGNDDHLLALATVTLRSAPT